MPTTPRERHPSLSLRYRQPCGDPPIERRCPGPVPLCACLGQVPASRLGAADLLGATPAASSRPACSLFGQLLPRRVNLFVPVPHGGRVAIPPNRGLVDLLYFYFKYQHPLQRLLVHSINSKKDCDHWATHSSGISNCPRRCWPNWARSIYRGQPATAPTCPPGTAKIHSTRRQRTRESDETRRDLRGSKTRPRPKTT